MAGTSRATVNRVLREEQDHGSVELGRGRTTLVDPARSSTARAAVHVDRHGHRTRARAR